MAPQYAIGIDLGTTNSVLAYTPLDDQARIELVETPQHVSPQTIEQLDGLPSFCYLATAEEQAAGAYDMPWQRGAAFSVGEWARAQSAQAPARTVSAAKSWLAHTRVDRHDSILPWNAPDDVSRISPLEASRRYLAHMAAAWNQQFAEAPIDQQQVVLTVPASFDVSARELTHEAALHAGLPRDLILLEEPQAAVYAWLDAAGDDWRSRMSKGDILLVCDVGGGTTDFSLVGVADEDGELALRRIAVGNHILVGGDNMDLTLAHHAQELFAGKHISLDPWQSVSLWHACRIAKEKLLADEAPESHPVTILGRGARLIGATVSADLDRTSATDALLEGFFPAAAKTDRPARRPASGFRQIGLPFEHDTAITRHLAHFLAAHGRDGELVRPTHILFNGGVFKPRIFRTRVVETIRSWFDNANIDVLMRAPDFDNAVARGAALYGHSKLTKGIRIRGGAPRSYYVGIETAGPAVPGMPRPLSALCVAPFGLEEGSEIDVPGEQIGLVVGEPAVFRFFSSVMRKDDRPGTVLRAWREDELRETDSLEAFLPAEERFDEGYVPVTFRTRITEVGMFELWCKSAVSDDRWKLEFSIRDA